MKKTYKLQDLDCANCAAKMENGVLNVHLPKRERVQQPERLKQITIG